MSLLLLRPSPMPNGRPLAPAAAVNVAAEPGVIAGLIPATAPTQSRFALRLLRAGYVHIYIEKPPPGVANWLVYRVTEQADLVPEPSGLFSQPDASVTCSRPEHVPSGLKVVSLPRAHKLADIWIAYSANLWNERLRDKNKADPQVMQKISLKDGGANTFKPTAGNLKAQVLECALTRLVIDGSADHEFLFNSVAQRLNELAAGLSAAAAKHPDTAGKELAVVLRDPIGVAAELNALRIRRHALIGKELAKPEIAHPLNSSNTILGMRRSLVEEQDLDSFEEVSPLRTRGAFLQQTWPAGTEWQALTPADRAALIRRAQKNSGWTDWLLSPYKKTFERDDLGRVFHPDHDARAAAWTQAKVEKHWSKLARYYDEEERAAWVEKFERRMKAEHHDPLKLMEEDWSAALHDAATLACFDRHFDTCSMPDPLKQPVDMVVYARENDRINVPAPFVDGPAVDRYVAVLDLDVSDKRAIAWRALAGNKDSTIKLVHQQLTGDPGAEGMRDKTFDLVKGFSELTSAQPAMMSYGWIGHTLALFSVGQMSALSAAVLTIAARSRTMADATRRMLGRLQGFVLVQRALECAVQGALKGGAPKLPVLVTMKISADQALEVFAARSGQQLGVSKTRIKKAKDNRNKLKLTLATDTDAIRAANGDLGELIKDPATGAVKMDRVATDIAIEGAAGRMPTISEQTFLRLYQEQAGRAANAANLMRSALPAMARTNTGADLMAMSKTLDARLALTSMVIQTIGLVNGVEAAGKAGSASELLDAQYGVLDSLCGLTGGAVALGAVAAELDVTRKQGATAVAANTRINLLKIAGNLTGVAGGTINAVALSKKSNDENARGNKVAAQLYWNAAYAFGGTAVTSVGLTAGSIAASLAARGIGGAAVQTVAARLGANAVLGTVLGVGVTVSGVGLLLLGAGVVLQVGAIVLTPSELQRWLGRSYFGRDGGLVFSGKRDDMFAKGDWAAEKLALDDLLKKSNADQKS